MNKSVFRVYTTYDREDGFNAWACGNSCQEAEREIRSEYHSIIRVELIRTEKR